MRYRHPAPTEEAPALEAAEAEAVPAATAAWDGAAVERTRSEAEAPAEEAPTETRETDGDALGAIALRAMSAQFDLLYRRPELRPTSLRVEGDVDGERAGDQLLAAARVLRPGTR